PAENQLEPVSDKLPRRVRLREPSHGLELEPGSAHAARRTVGDRQVLDRGRMPILQARITDLSAREIPTPTDLPNGLDRPLVLFRQPVEGIAPRGTRSRSRHLFDAEVIGLTLEFHATRNERIRPSGEHSSAGGSPRGF